jgi:hypothetical protein
VPLPGWLKYWAFDFAPSGDGFNKLQKKWVVSQFESLLVGVIPMPRVFTSGARACPELVEGDLACTYAALNLN